MGRAKRRVEAAEPGPGDGGAETSGSLSFEAALAELEGTVARLEKGDMPLELALELFERGVALSRQCHDTLDAAERRVELLTAEREGDGETWRAEPFEAVLDDDDPGGDEDSGRSGE